MLNPLILCSIIFIAGLRAQVLVTQLVEGQLQPTQPGTFKFVASVTLVRMPGMNMIIDTTAPTDIVSRNLILQRLSSLSLSPQQINVLVLTHGHADHAGGAMLFPNAKLVTDFFEISGDQFVANELRQADAMELLPAIELWKVPGHTPEDIAVIVRNAIGLGTVAIAGDVFYTSAEGLADTPVWTQTALDAVRGKLSQQRVLCNVNYIVPGHGAMFAVTPQMRNFYRCQNAQRVNPVRRAQPFVLPPVQQGNAGSDLASNCAQNAGLCNNPTYFQLMSRNCCRTCNRCGVSG